MRLFPDKQTLDSEIGFFVLQDAVFAQAAGWKQPLRLHKVQETRIVPNDTMVKSREAEWHSEPGQGGACEQAQHKPEQHLAVIRSSG